MKFLRAIQLSPPAGRSPRYVLSQRLELGLLLAPYLLGLALLIGLPALLAIPLAFTDFDALSAPRWSGLANLAELVRDELFWNGLRASLVFGAIAVPLRLMSALGLALVLHRPGRGVGFMRAAVYAPTILPDVAYALVWLAILNPVSGPLNPLADLLAGPDVRREVSGEVPAPNWLLYAVPAQVAMALIYAWTIGEGFVLLLAARRAVPAALHEAAALDGAGAWQTWCAITLPFLAPFLLLLSVRDIVFSLQQTFVAASIVTRGGPYYATTYLPYYVYQIAADDGRFGYAATLTLVMLLVSSLLVLGQFKLARRWQTDFADD